MDEAAKDRLIAALRADLAYFGESASQHCEKCGAPIRDEEDASTISDVRGCWGAIADVKNAPCWRYRTAAGADQTWPPCEVP